MIKLTFKLNLLSVTFLTLFFYTALYILFLYSLNRDTKNVHSLPLARRNKTRLRCLS